MAFSRRKLILGALGSLGGRAAGKLSLATFFDGSESGLETAVRDSDINGRNNLNGAPHPSKPAYHGAEDLASRIKGLARRPTIVGGQPFYRQFFIAYNDIINEAQNFAQRASSHAERLDYKSLMTIALMYQADLLVKQAGNNVVRGEPIRLTGFKDTTAGSRLTDGFYNHLKALEDYETVLRINDDLEKEGHRLPKNVGYRMGDFGQTASRDLINLRMYETITKLLNSPNLPEQYRVPFQKRAYELAQSRARMALSN